MSSNVSTVRRSQLWKVVDSIPNNQMDVNECHKTLFQMSEDLRFTNHLFLFDGFIVALVSHQGVTEFFCRSSLFCFRHFRCFVGAVELALRGITLFSHIVKSSMLRDKHSFTLSRSFAC
jgi:hypothetical protein